MVWSNRHPSDDRLLLAIGRVLSPRRQRAIDAHLAGCARCAQRGEELRRQSTILFRAVQPSAAPEERAVTSGRERLVRELVVASVGQSPSGTGASLFYLPRLHAVLALGAVCVVVGLGFNTLRRAIAVRQPGVVTADDRVALPNASLTPGATWAITADDLCVGARQAPRAIPHEMRQGVLRAYRMEHVPSTEYELDYLITPELGGATDPANLWPERYGAHVWDARVKDQLETLLPALVCRGEIDLRVAQHEIAANWISAYKKYFRTSKPIRNLAGLVHADEEDAEVARAWPAPGPALTLISFRKTP